MFYTSNVQMFPCGILANVGHASLNLNYVHSIFEAENSISRIAPCSLLLGLEYSNTFVILIFTTETGRIA
jgi:hypothetical protein